MTDTDGQTPDSSAGETASEAESSKDVEVLSDIAMFLRQIARKLEPVTIKPRFPPNLQRLVSIIDPDECDAEKIATVRDYTVRGAFDRRNDKTTARILRKDDTDFSGATITIDPDLIDRGQLTVTVRTIGNIKAVRSDIGAEDNSELRLEITQIIDGHTESNEALFFKISNRPPY